MLNCRLNLENYGDPYQKCYDCEEKDIQMDKAKHYFEGILDQFYGAKKFDKDRLESLLEEVAHQLDVKFPNKDIKKGIRF